MNVHKLGPKFKLKLEKQRKHSKALICNFRTLARFIRTLNEKSSISFEWPKHSDGWPLIVDIENEFGVKRADFEGCQLGVTNSAGIPLKKPWTII